MLLTTGNITQPHTITGIVNATSHLMLTSETIDAFESMDQLFPDVEEKMKQKAIDAGADGIINISFNTEVAQLQVAPKFLVVTGYGTLINFSEE
ncbi:YbjQ family protein [Paucilactobacillus wasatchensis]|uniref:Heavy metal-binding domain-containing protein n=1 Tax=Paucilactobacillus wasatchensis TaxID=1335616 RepID=A0A0D0YV52_9LACO|nr:hypothetical protein [Paucilactobacillus wasatchensis]KIS03154.1 hypothetical protein WDC_1275 [Paucilactobacillus wasatchensis]